MHITQVHEGLEQVKTIGLAKKPSGAGCSPEQIEGCDRLEVWGTSFTDPGPDYTEFRFFKDGVPVRTERVEGY